jgi:hypothetical protein
MAHQVINRIAVDSELEEEFERWWGSLITYIEENPETFKELKSKELFREGFGTIVLGGYVMVFKVDSAADLERLSNRLLEDEGYKKLEVELSALSLPSPGSAMVWTDRF